MKKRYGHLGSILVVLALLMLPIPPADLVAQRKGPGASPGLSQQPNPNAIAGSPLRILVGANASIQVYYTGYVEGQVFGDADSGIFLWVGDRLFGSNLEGSHHESAANYTLDLTTVSHTGPSGQGTAADPWVIITVLDVGDTGLRVTQKVSYVQGQEHFGLTWDIENRSGEALSLDFFHAADIFFAGDDYGYGYYDPVTGAVGGYNADHSSYMTFVPLTPATHHQEADFAVIWENIGYCAGDACYLGPGLNDTISSEYVDNGIGLQWHLDLAAGQSAHLGDHWTLGAAPITPEPTPTPLPTDTPLPAPTPTNYLPPAPTPTPIPPTEIPEAGSLLLLGSGLGALLGYARLIKRRKPGR